jgi:uncharacterized protein involved in exopolysaccharide biosynthesis
MLASLGARDTPSRWHAAPDELEGWRPTDLRTTVRCLWVKRWFVISGALVCSIISFAAAFLIPPVYQAKTVLIAARSEQPYGGLGAAISQLGGIGSLVGLDVGTNDDKVQEALAVLRSQQFTRGFIAIAPDVDDPVWSNKVLFLTLGPLVGLAVSAFSVLAWGKLGARSTASPSWRRKSSLSWSAPAVNLSARRAREPLCCFGTASE